MPNNSARRRSASVVRSGDVEVITNGGKHYVLDMDAKLAESGHTPTAAKEVFVMKLFDENFRVRKQINLLQFLLIDEDDPRSTADSIKGVIDMIHPDDQARFRTAIAANAALDQDAINELVSGMISAAAAPNPTASRRGSTASSRRNTSKALSAAS